MIEFSKTVTIAGKKSITASKKLGADWWQKAEITIRQVEKGGDWAVYSPNLELMSVKMALRPAKVLAEKILNLAQEIEDLREVFVVMPDKRIIILRTAYGKMAGGTAPERNKRIQDYLEENSKS